MARVLCPARCSGSTAGGCGCHPRVSHRGRTRFAHLPARHPPAATGGADHPSSAIGISRNVACPINGDLWGKFALMSEVKFSPAARAKFGFRRVKLTAVAVSEIAASGSSDKVPQPKGLPNFITTAVPAVISLSTLWIISLSLQARISLPNGQFHVRASPHILSPTNPHLLN